MRREILQEIRKLKKGMAVTVRWADAAEIRELSKSKIVDGRIPEPLLRTIMTHRGRFIGIQREPDSGKRYLILLLKGNGKVSVAAIPLDLIVSLERKARRGRSPVKMPMLVKKYAGGEVKSSGGVVKIASK